MELLKKLTEESGVSGRENKVAKLIISHIEKYCDNYHIDALGNLIVRKGNGGKKVLVLAHMDEIGIIITHKDEKGFLRFSAVGGVRAKDLCGRRVQFENGTNGVIWSEDNNDKNDIAKLYVDTMGLGNINVGDTAVFVGDYYENGDMIVSKALDNRVGCYVAIEALKKLQDTSNELYFVFTVQEEVGLRGSKTASYQVDADVALAIDVTATGDTPSCTPMEVKLGGGAAVKVMDRSIICHSEIRNGLVNAAKSNKIPYQMEILTFGGTDAGSAHLSGTGIKTGAISVPTRYIHSPSECVSKRDIKSCIDLAVCYIKSI